MQPYPPVSMPWWKSRIIIGALISILMKLLVAFGVAAELSDAETAQVADLVLIAIGAIGDLVAIGSRVLQRHAPKITRDDEGGGGLSNGLALFVGLALLFPLASCATLAPPAPAAIANATTIDERAALSITLAYTASARAAAVAIEAGLIRDPAAIRQIGALDRRAYAAVQTAEQAYRAGNAASFADAEEGARKAVARLLAAIKGEPS